MQFRYHIQAVSGMTKYQNELPVAKQQLALYNTRNDSVILQMKYVYIIYRQGDTSLDSYLITTLTLKKTCITKHVFEQAIRFREDE